MMRFITPIILLTVSTLAGIVGRPNEAHAIIGRPLTPISYAGVARRSVRRTAAVATTAAVVTTAAVATTATVAVGTRVAALPAGCAVYAVSYYSCGPTYYRPYYDGPNVIYVAVAAP